MASLWSSIVDQDGINDDSNVSGSTSFVGVMQRVDARITMAPKRKTLLFLEVGNSTSSSIGSFSIPTESGMGMGMGNGRGQTGTGMGNGRG